MERPVDKILTCKYCQKAFVWTMGEQYYYHDRELTEPKRCPICRHKRKVKITLIEVTA